MLGLLLVARQEVVPLTPDTFDDFVKNNAHVFVKFYAPWCGHCKALAPVFLDVSNQVNIPLAEVDCEAHRDLCGRFNVTGFPTLKMFTSGEPQEYNGGRDLQSLKGYINAMTKEFLVKVKKEDLKNEAKRRGLDIYFTVYAKEEKYGTLKSQLNAFDAFFFFVATNDSTKVVVQRQDYEFVLNNADNINLIARFVN